MIERYVLGEPVPLTDNLYYIPLERKPLTSTQYETYAFLYEADIDGRRLSIRNIMDRFDLKTPSAGHERLQSLYDKGYINYEKGKSRSAIPLIPLDRAEIKGEEVTENSVA